MCGIVGIVQSENAAPLLLKGLERLEYRGYDSSGIVVWNQDKKHCEPWSDLGFYRHRSVGSIQNLKESLPQDIQGSSALGHTRWATHGSAHESNAHPHKAGSVFLVHNGILENFDALKRDLLAQGRQFQSETDTEVIAHILNDCYHAHHQNLQKSLCKALSLLEGNFTLAMMWEEIPETLVVVRKGMTPMVIGSGPEGHVISSDALGCVSLADRIAYLPSDTWAIVKKHHVQLYDFQGQEAPAMTYENHPFAPFSIEKGQFKHYMLKEIYEQSSVMSQLLSQNIPSLPSLIQQPPSHITLLGCGTSFYAAWIGKYYLEHLCPTSVELASEFHYRQPRMIPGLTIALSQSGETADTLKAMTYAKDQGQLLLSIVNSPHSALARSSQWVLETQAGPEISVASTKSFTAQLWMLLALSGILKNPKDQEASTALPLLMEQVLLQTPAIQSMAKILSYAQSLFYLGRGPLYPLALEGALKMKELAYIHAEGLAAGELKHGSLALMDQDTPVIMLMPSDPLFNKNLMNLHELAAHNGNIWVITDPEGAQNLGSVSVRDVLMIPQVPNEALSPFLYALVLQLLAYYTALHKGCPIDQPRHLAKSVTVE